MSTPHSFGKAIRPTPAQAKRSRGTRRVRPRAGAVAAAAMGVAALAGARPAGAAALTQVWDPGESGASGGPGNWDTTSPFWDNTTSATTKQTWQNGSGAVFNGAGGLVTITSLVGASSLTFNSSGYNLAGGTLELNGSTPTFNYSYVTTTTPTTLNITALLDGTAGATFSGQSSSYAYALSGANTYAGTTIVQQCTVNFNSLAVTGTPSSLGTSGDVDIGGSVTSASGSATVLNYTGTGAGSTDRLWTITGKSPSDGINNNGGGPLSFTSTGAAVEGVVGPRTLVLGGTYTGAANNFAETLADLGTSPNVTALTVKAGLWNIASGSNSYSGGTNISAGTAIIALAGSLGTGPVSFSGATGYLNASSGLTLTNPINTSSAATAQLRSSAPLLSTFQVAGLISGAGNVQVATGGISKAGGVELSDDANSFAGTFTTGYGLVEYTSVANAGAVSSLGAGLGAYVFSNSTSTLTFQYLGQNNDTTNRAINWAASGTSANAGALNLDASGGGTVQFLSTAALRSGSSAALLTLTGTNANANTLAQVINDGSTGTNGTATTVNKTNSGKWVLTNANTYSGGTNVSAGTLVVNGTGSLGTGTATVYGGVLAGNGSTGTGSVNLSGGSITGGSGATTADSLGKLTLGGPAYLGGGTFDVKLDLANATPAVSPTGNDGSSVPANGSGVTIVSDKLVISGLLTASAATTTAGSSLLITPVPISGAAPYQVYSFVIADAQTNASSGAGAFDALLQGPYPQIALSTTTDAQGDTYSLGVMPDSGTGEDLLLDVTAAPEPTSLLLAAAVTAPLALRRPRRGRQIPAQG